MHDKTDLLKFPVMYPLLYILIYKNNAGINPG